MLKSFYQDQYLEAGCDEAGRGCLAGPVFAASVVLPIDYKHPQLNDSKQLSSKKRELLRHEIQKEAIAWSVASADPEEIDKLNILNASFLAVHRALDKLPVLPGFIIMDGNRFMPYRDLPHKCIVKGDAIYFSIAAASILAKTYRDEYMLKLDKKHPEYYWRHNKGYPTSGHRNAIKATGLTPYHRKTFRQVNFQLELEFKFIED